MNDASSWLPTDRCLSCGCPIYTISGIAVTPVCGAEHMCGVNCACALPNNGTSATEGLGR